MQRQPEPSMIEDKRQTDLWQQTIEIGRKARQADAQQESSQERELQKRQMSL